MDNSILTGFLDEATREEIEEETWELCKDLHNICGNDYLGFLELLDTEKVFDASVSFKQVKKAYKEYQNTLCPGYEVEFYVNKDDPKLTIGAVIGIFYNTVLFKKKHYIVLYPNGIACLPASELRKTGYKYRDIEILLSRLEKKNEN